MEVGSQVNFWRDYVTENRGYHLTISLAKSREDSKMDLRQPKQLESDFSLQKLKLALQTAPENSSLNTLAC